MTDIEYEWQELWPSEMGSITRDVGLPEIKPNGPIVLSFDPVTPNYPAAKTNAD